MSALSPTEDLKAAIERLNAWLADPYMLSVRAADLRLLLSSRPLVLGEVVEALKPFAALVDYFEDAKPPWPDSIHLNHEMTLGDCRRARQALSVVNRGGEP